MKTSKLILWGLICMIAAMPAFAQSRSEKKARIERAVKEAVDAKTYEINVDRMHPIKGGSRTLTTNYSLKVRNDSVYSYLPYFGVAYSVPYGGGKVYKRGILQKVTQEDCRTQKIVTTQNIYHKDAISVILLTPPFFSFLLPATITNKKGIKIGYYCILFHFFRQFIQNNVTTYE